MIDQSKNNAQNSGEIDLGQLFGLIQKGLNNLFVRFLRLFLFLKKNILILTGLLVLGLAAGYGLNQVTSKKLKTDVIVKPNLQSKNYLYDVIDEIQANISADNLDFFKEIGIELTDLKGLEVTIAPVNQGKENTKEELKYLELLQSFENTEAISDIVRAELQNKNSFNHRITFFYKDLEKGEVFAQKITEYINTNRYFNGLIKVQRANAASRIERNNELLKQVDDLITIYSEELKKQGGSGDRIVLDNQERINFTGLFGLKNNLIKDIESKNIELQERTTPIKIINFGKSQEVQKAFFAKSMIKLPLLLVGAYFLFSFILFLNRSAKEMNL